MASIYNPWHGCHKVSDGCQNCYIFKGNLKRGIDTNQIVKAKNFTRVIDKNKNNTYKMKSSLVYLCFDSDFLLEEADKWRDEVWDMIKERQDCQFLFLTKRIDRLKACLPADWYDGYENVIVGVSVENQAMADYRLPILLDLPIKHKVIAAQPLISEINLEKYLNGIEQVVVGGEYGELARELDYNWVLDLKSQCQKAKVNFTFRQYATYNKKNNNQFKLTYFQVSKLARLEEIDLVFYPLNY